MRDVTRLRKVVAEHQATRRKLAAVLGLAIAVVDELRGDNDGRAGDSHIEHEFSSLGVVSLCVRALVRSPRAGVVVASHLVAVASPLLP
jgi:hypothetical protein